MREAGSEVGKGEAASVPPGEGAALILEKVRWARIRARRRQREERERAQ